jgi:hypothetical protein
MRTLITVAVGVVAIGLLADGVFAHGGTYGGATGGGTQSGGGAAGGGTTPGPGNPGPGPTGGGGTTTSPGGGSTPNPSGPPPVRPGGGGRAGGGSSARGGVTGGAKKSVGPSLTSWDLWWDYNDDRFLNLKQKVRSLAQASDNSDTFLGTLGGDTSNAKVTANQIREDILPALLIGLKDPYYDARAGAVIALGKVGEAERADVIEAIRGLLKDTARQVQESACLALGILGAKEAIPDLLEISKNSPRGKALAGTGTGDVLTRTRAFAAMGIGMIGTRQDLDR